MDKFDEGSSGLEYKLLKDGKSYSVIGIGTCIDTSIIIPSFYNGKPIVSISQEAFIGSKNISSIAIGDNVVSIGDCAFVNCENLSSIKISNSVTHIGDYIIMGCNSLKRICLPYKVKIIDSCAFSGCFSLEYLEVDKSNRYYDSREDCNAIIETETNTLLKGCKNSFIPDSITCIGYFAFEDCDFFESIYIPDDVKIIDDGAFSNCKKLREITIGSGVTFIGDYAFENCELLKVINYKGTEDQWNNISIGCENDLLKNSIIIYNYIE